ncbi:MAG TPA: amino acid adenylation domain-containing protein [Kutzneria sp.]|nr:amino acid adenylation domain-containing protein [Kutzneria sp.]
MRTLLTPDPENGWWPFPLNEIQESFYVGRRLGDGTGIGTQVQVEFEPADLDVDRLESTWNELVNRTGMLRAVVLPDATQEIRDIVPYYRVETVDVASPEELASLREANSGSGFDPHAWPMFSIKVARLADGRSRVFFAVDEMIADGPSVSLLLRQWYALYRGDQPQLPEISFRDYVLGTQVRPDRLNTALEYWRGKLADADLDRPAPLLAATPGEERARTRRSLKLAEKQWSVVKQAAMAGRATPSALLLALYTTAVSIEDGTNGLPVVLTTYNRNPVHPDVAHLVGPFISTSVFLAPAATGSLGDLLAAVRGQLWRDLEHSTVGGVRAQREWARRDRSRAGGTIPLVYTSLLGSLAQAGSDVDPDSWAMLVDDESTSTYTPGVYLEQVVQERAGELTLSWDVAADVLDDVAVERAFGRLAKALDRIAESGADALHLGLAELLAAPAIQQDKLPLTEVQSAYLVGRIGDLAGTAETRVYQEFVLHGHDVDRIEASWRQLIRHHPMLRGIVHEDGTLSVQATTPEYTIARHDLSGLDAPGVERELSAIAERLRATVFGVGRWPMFVMEASTLPGGDVVLHVVLDALMADAQSFALLFGQLFALHDGKNEVLKSGADGLARHLKAMAELAESPAADQVSQEWKAKFEQLPAGPPLPDGGPGAERVHRRFDLDSWTALCAKADKVGVPADMLMLTAYTDALREQFPQPFTIVVVSWDRPAGTEQIVGDFTGLSWLVVDDTLPAGFEDRAREIWARVQEDLKRGAVKAGLAQLRQRVFRSRGALRLPVVFTRIPDVPKELHSDAVEVRQSQSQTAQVALDNVPLLVGDAVVCQWDAAVGALSDAQLTTMFAAYERRMRSLVTQDDPQWTVVDLLAQSFKRNGNEPAIRWNGDVISYADLDRRSAQLANHLIRHGLEPGEHVAVHMDRSDNLVVALVAVVRAGAVYVPVDPVNPADRVRFLIEDSGAKLVIADGARADIPGVHVVCPDRDAALLAAESATAPTVEVGPLDPVYMIYTSGTTGLPKGCRNTQRGVANRLLWMQDTFPLSTEDRVLQKTPYGFDVSAWEFFWPLLVGASIVVARPGGHVDTAYLAGLIRDEQVTITHFVPSVLGMFLRDPAAADCTSLRYVFASGEALPVGTMHTFFDVLADAELHNLYGPTEAAIDVTHWACRKDWDEPTVPIGHAVANTRIHIVDEQLRDVPNGTPGEIVIAGHQVALGYHNRPELNAEKFVGGRYRTGDLGVVAEDGEIRYLGRIDNQFKLRGLRIEPEEIEAALVSKAGLADARVLPVTAADGDANLAAVCVPNGEPPAVSAIRKALGEALPKYMVPNLYRFVAELPLTPNGKLDRGKATELFADKPAETPSSTTVGLTAEAVAEIAAGLLGTSDLAVDADLFDLGATSFTMIRLAQALADKHGVDVPVDILIDSPTPAGIVAGLGDSAPTTKAADIRIAFDPAAKKAFKEAKIAQRELAVDAERLALPAGGAQETLELFDARSFRDFVETPMDVKALTELLALAAAGQLGGNAKRRYPSAGGFYPVQVYLYVRHDRIAGVDGGLYFLHPEERSLVRLDPELRVSAETQVQHNKAIVGGAAFGLFLVSTPAAIAPAYGERLATRYSGIEAGHISQLLMTAAPAKGLGLCPVGEMDFESIKHHFRLDEDQELLVSLWGGALTAADVEQRVELADTEAVVEARPSTTSVVEPIAIIGFAAKLPGADTLEEFDELLAGGGTAIGPAPLQRWAPLKPRGERQGIEVGGYLTDVHAFEADEFRISEEDAKAVDPQEHLLLATTRKCLEDAGITAQQLSEQGQVGVFVGAMWADHALHGVPARARGEVGTHATRGGLAHRISHTFNLTGPSVVLDTGCVSGLAAIDAAVRAIRAGQCTTAVAAASNLVLHPDHLDVLSELGLVAEETDSCAFTDRASGWIVGEGVGTVLLKPLRQAIADGDPIHAVIRGGAVQHSGTTRQFGLPNRKRQEETFRAALTDAGLPATAIGYVEAAASGAALADMLEVAGLNKVFADNESPVLVGSVKPVTGHLEAASVFGQLGKLICQFRAGHVYATRLTSDPNPGVLSADHVELARRTVKWKREADEPRRALVNGFAGGGSYGCLVVEEPPEFEVRDNGGRHALPISADTPANLAALADALADAIDRDSAPSLSSVAKTLTEGRKDREERAVVVTSATDAAEALRELAQNIKAGQRIVGSDELAESWLAGNTVAWPREDVRRVSLPATPLKVTGERKPEVAAEAGTDAEPLQRLVHIVTEVTGIAAAKLAPGTDLLALGVTSRQLQRIAAQVHADGGAQLALETLFETENMAELAEAAFGGRQ